MSKVKSKIQETFDQKVKKLVDLTLNKKASDEKDQKLKEEIDQIKASGKIVYIPHD